MKRRVNFMTAKLLILIARIVEILLLFIAIKKISIQMWKQTSFAKIVRRNNYSRVLYLKMPANAVVDQNPFVVLFLLQP